MRNYRKLKMILISTLVLIIIAAGIGYANRAALTAIGFDIFLSDKVEASFKDSYVPLKDRPVMEIQPEVKKPFSMLLMGVDARGNERGRSDTLLYTVVRPEDGKVLMVSIPRDTYAELVGRDDMDKITHAYVYGEAEMTVNSVEKLLNTKVDHYASINFQGFVKVVDTLGGIPLPIGKDIVNKHADHEKFVVKANQDSYSGVDALNYVRYREDAGGDVSRTGRNQAFLESLMNKASSMKQWDKIPEVLNIVGDHFITDLPPESMSKLAKQFLQSGHEITSYTLIGEGKRMGPNNLWYYVADEDELVEIGVTIDAWLNPNTDQALLTVPNALEAEETTELEGNKD